MTCGLVCILSGIRFYDFVKRMSGYIRYISDNGGESGKISNVQVSGKKRMGSGLFALIFSSEMLLIIAAVMCNGVLKDGLDFGHRHLSVNTLRYRRLLRLCLCL